MLKSLFIWAVFLGIAGLLIALIAKSGIGPAWFTELDLTIAAVSGILIGGGLGAWLDGFRNPQERLYVSVSVIALGLLYVFIAAVPLLQDKDFVQSLDIYFAAGGAISGSALSVILAHLRKQWSRAMLGERPDQRGLWEADQLYLDLVCNETGSIAVGVGRRRCLAKHCQRAQFRPETAPGRVFVALRWNLPYRCENGTAWRRWGERGGQKMK